MLPVFAKKKKKKCLSIFNRNSCNWSEDIRVDQSDYTKQLGFKTTEKEKLLPSD